MQPDQGFLRAIGIAGALAQPSRAVDRIDMLQAAKAVLAGAPVPEPGTMVVNRFQWRALGGTDEAFDALPTADFGDDDAA